jgi:hypothetical protein
MAPVYKAEDKGLVHIGIIHNSKAIAIRPEDTAKPFIRSIDTLDKGPVMIVLFLDLAIDMAYGPSARGLAFAEIHIISYLMAVYCLIGPIDKPYPLPFGIGLEGIKGRSAT